jgi:hypothetical protein
LDVIIDFPGHVDDIEDIARDHIAVATGIASSHIDVDVNVNPPVPNALRMMRTQIATRGFGCSEPQFAGGNWMFDVESTPQSSPVAVGVAHIGCTAAEASRWSPESIRWMTDTNSYSGQAHHTPIEVADLILQTVIADNA